MQVCSASDVQETQIHEIVLWILAEWFVKASCGQRHVIDFVSQRVTFLDMLQVFPLEVLAYVGWHTERMDASIES